MIITMLCILATTILPVFFFILPDSVIMLQISKWGKNSRRQKLSILNILLFYHNNAYICGRNYPFSLITILPVPVAQATHSLFMIVSFTSTGVIGIVFPRSYYSAACAVRHMRVIFTREYHAYSV